MSVVIDILMVIKAGGQAHPCHLPPQMFAGGQWYETRYFWCTDIISKLSVGYCENKRVENMTMGSSLWRLSLSLRACQSWCQWSPCVIGQQKREDGPALLMVVRIIRFASPFSNLRGHGLTDPANMSAVYPIKEQRTSDSASWAARMNSGSSCPQFLPHTG